MVAPLLLGGLAVAALQHGEAAASPAMFFLVIVAILATAKALGELAERIGQPAVLGELLAGVLLGASVFAVIPETGPIAEVVELLAEVGVAILLFEIGLETDLREMARVGGTAAVVAIVGVATPFLLGFAYWWMVDPAIGTHPEGITLTMVAIFIGATLTATSVGITARVLNDLGRIHTPEARVIIGAAVVDDVLGLVILAIVSGLAAGATLTPVDIGLKFLIAGGFLVAAVIVGNLAAPRIFGFIDRLRVRGVLVVAAVCFALLFAALASLAGSAMIIGAFAAGIVLSSTNQFDLIEERVKPVADVFTPIFFVSVGASVNVLLLVPGTGQFDPGVIGVGAALVGIAVIGKFVSGYAVGWGKARLSHAAIGVGMIPRGEVGLIFADLGLSNGILSRSVFSAVLIMVMVTTFVTPPLLKIIFRRTQAGEGTERPPVHDVESAAHLAE